MKKASVMVPEGGSELGATNRLKTILSDGVRRDGKHYYRREIQ